MADDPADPITALLDELGGGEDLSVRLERVAVSGLPAGMAGYLGSLPLTPDFLEDVKREYGGGRYRGRVQNGRTYLRSVQFVVAGMPRRADDPPAPAVPPAPAADPVAELRGELRELRELLTHRSVAAPDPVAQVVAVAQALRELTPQATSGDPSGMVGLIREVLELRREVAEDAGPAGDAASMAGAVRAFSETVREVMAFEREKLNVRQRRLTPGAAQPSKPAPNGAQPAQSAAPAASPVGKLAAQVPAIGRTLLANAARSNADPEDYAGAVLAQLPESIVVELPALLALPNFAPELCAAVPQWAAYPGWFAELAECMSDRLSGDDDDEQLGVGESDEQSDDESGAADGACGVVAE